MEKWIRGSYAYSSKRGNKLYLNVLIEDENSIYRDDKHNWIRSYVIIEKGLNDKSVTIKFSEFNNCEKIVLSQDQESLVKEYALEISQKYNLK